MTPAPDEMIRLDGRVIVVAGVTQPACEEARGADDAPGWA